MYFDGHFHYAVCANRSVFDVSSIRCDDFRRCDSYDNCENNVELGYNSVQGIKENGNELKINVLEEKNWRGLSCAHSIDEWNIQCQGALELKGSIFQAFGIHPQIVGNCDIESCKDFLLGLAEQGKLDAIGEAGFDFFTEDFKATRELQENVWAFQLETAIRYGLPLVVHCRKGNELLFRDVAKLKKVPAVLFHSFMGSFVEASSLIKKGINCFFSFGKQLMNNNKKVIDCVKNLPIENLLMETDSPFQTLKGEENTFLSDIVRIYNGAYKLRYGGEGDICSYEHFDEFLGKLEENSRKLLLFI